MAAREAIVGKSHRRQAIWLWQSIELMETCLMQVDAALKRIEEGEFGKCVECEEPISPKRLASAPWTNYCLRCQDFDDSLQAA